jgi:hypothetical protein
MWLHEIVRSIGYISSCRRTLSSRAHRSAVCLVVGPELWCGPTRMHITMFSICVSVSSSYFDQIRRMWARSWRETGSGIQLCSSVNRAHRPLRSHRMARKFRNHGRHSVTSISRQNRLLTTSTIVFRTARESVGGGWRPIGQDLVCERRF